MSEMVAIRSATSVVVPFGPTEDLGEVTTEVVGCGDNEPPGGEAGGEEGGLVAKTGKAVTEDNQWIATWSNRDAEPPPLG